MKTFFIFLALSDVSLTAKHPMLWIRDLAIRSYPDMGESDDQHLFSRTFPKSDKSGGQSTKESSGPLSTGSRGVSPPSSPSLSQKLTIPPGGSVTKPQARTRLNPNGLFRSPDKQDVKMAKEPDLGASSNVRATPRPFPMKTGQLGLSSPVGAMTGSSYFVPTPGYRDEAPTLSKGLVRENFKRGRPQAVSSSSTKSALPLERPSTSKVLTMQVIPETMKLPQQPIHKASGSPKSNQLFGERANTAQPVLANTLSQQRNYQFGDAWPTLNLSPRLIPELQPLNLPPHRQPSFPDKMTRLSSPHPGFGDNPSERHPNTTPDTPRTSFN